jgi:hypothetical protein
MHCGLAEQSQEPDAIKRYSCRCGRMLAWQVQKVSSVAKPVSLIAGKLIFFAFCERGIQRTSLAASQIAFASDVDSQRAWVHSSFFNYASSEQHVVWYLVTSSIVTGSGYFTGTKARART